MKICTACMKLKPLGQFRKRQGRCMLCQDAMLRERYLRQREEILAHLRSPEQRELQRARDKVRYQKPERRQASSEASARYRARHPERRRETNAVYNQKPEAKLRGASRTAKRRAAKLQATPTWADHGIIGFFYASMAYLRSEGVDVHVDHIIPLQGRTVRGLHTHNNLRLLFAELNHRKNNKLIY